MSARAPRTWCTDERLASRRKLLMASVLLAAGLVVGRAVQLQGFEGDRWRAKAAEQQQARVTLPARRGAIYDRDGTALALTRETYSVAVAPREVRDRKAAVDRLVKALGMTRAAARRAVHTDDPWVVLPGRFTVEQRRELGSLRGFHYERKLERFYPQGDVGREVLGRVSGDERALGGIEQALDSVLSGKDGFSVMRKDGRGARTASLSLPVAPPEDGADVHLTLDFDLQEIADAALGDAITSTRASGGDLLLADPETGEILAAVSRRAGGSRGLGAFIEPYEPGSTLKPFFVASLLANRRATLADRVYAEAGRWTTPTGRVISDVHPYEWLSLRDGLRVSSNIAMAKLVDRLPAGEQYAGLRDFGFGTPTGVEYPAEAAGRLTRPGQWSKLTPASLAMGYEVSATPIQMAMAYGALANGGTLMEPRLVREVRAAGRTLERREPRAVRRVVPARVAADLREVLVSVVEDGTATRASLATFELAGKTGTARRTGPDGRYEAGAYNATFVGFFPARDPQLVIYVKLDRPRGDYYGGLTAAPVTREALQAILAAHSPGIDRRGLLAARHAPAGTQNHPTSIRARSASVEGSEGTYVFHSNDLPKPVAERTAATVPVPELAGASMRDAARRLHALGFRVRVQGAGRVAGTRPAAGTMLPRGDTLTVLGAGD